MNIHAITLGEGERIIAVVRRHWFHLAVEGVVDAFIFLTLVLFVGIAESYFLRTEVASVLPHQSLSLSLYVLAFVALLLWMHFFASWSDHWLDAWIITNKRIIDIEQHGFFRRQVSSFPLDRIQDVTFSINGVIAMWLHFGNVRIQTASISDDLNMKQVSFPEDVKEAVVRALEQNRS